MSAEAGFSGHQNVSGFRLRPAAPIPRKTPHNLLALLAVLRNNPLEAWTEAHFELPIVQDGLPFMKALVVSDPDAIKHVLLDNAANYRKDDLLLRIISPGLGDGLLTVEGDQWRRQRRTVAPMFARRTIYDFAPEMQAAVDALVSEWQAIPNGTIVDVSREMTGLTLEVLRRTIFSHGIDRDTQDLRSSMRSYFDSIGRIDPFDVFGLPDFMPRPTRRRERAALRYFKSAVSRIIDERRRLLCNGRDVPRDLLTLLLEAGDMHSGSRLNDAEIRANVFTFIVAGHETTANALIWSLYLLSQDETWADRVAAESSNSRPAESDDPTVHLTAARAVVEEALRLYPPIAAISRVATACDEIGGEIIRPGTMVIVAPYVVHRHRMLWDEPDLFDPWRFMDSARQRIGRYAYLPFGTGPRVCIGSAFALQEATLVLSSLVRRFRFRLAAGSSVEPLLRVTLRPRGGLPMLIEPRSAD